MGEEPVSNQPYVDPGHKVPDNEWAVIVQRAKEIREQTQADAQGGAASGIAPVLDMTGKGIASRKYFPVSGVPTQLLVLHSAECPLAGGYAQSLTEWAASVYPADPIASWQRFVDPLVRLRFIPDDLGAWHASEANPLSIGWEQAGYARYSRDQWLTPDGRTQMESLAFDMAEVALRDSIPARWLSDQEVRAVLDGGNRSIKGFCFHRQIDPETRTDPGGGYPADLLMERIKFYMGNGPTSVAPQSTSGGFLMALSDKQQEDLYNALCTEDGRRLLARSIVNYEVPWFGFDGKQPPEGQRRTVNATAVWGWHDTGTGMLAGKLDAQAAQLQALAGAVATLGGANGATKDEILAQLDKSVKDTLGPLADYQPVFAPKGVDGAQTNG